MIEKASEKYGCFMIWPTLEEEIKCNSDRWGECETCHASVSVGGKRRNGAGDVLQKTNDD